MFYMLVNGVDNILDITDNEEKAKRLSEIYNCRIKTYGKNDVQKVNVAFKVIFNKSGYPHETRALGTDDYFLNMAPAILEDFNLDGRRKTQVIIDAESAEIAELKAIKLLYYRKLAKEREKKK